MQTILFALGIFIVAILVIFLVGGFFSWLIEQTRLLAKDLGLPVGHFILDFDMVKFFNGAPGTVICSNPDFDQAKDKPDDGGPPPKFEAEILVACEPGDTRYNQIRYRHQDQLFSWNCYWGLGNADTYKRYKRPTPDRECLIEELKVSAGSSLVGWSAEEQYKGREFVVMEEPKRSWNTSFFSSSKTDGVNTVTLKTPRTAGRGENVVTESYQKYRMTRHEDSTCQCIDHDANCCFCIAPGWASDLWYYSCQYHPFLSIFLHSENSRLKALERVFMEATTIVLGVVFAYESREATRSSTKFWCYTWNMILSMAIWEALFYLFAAPCFIKRERDNWFQRMKSNVCSCLSETCAYVICAFIFGFSWFWLLCRLEGAGGFGNDEYVDVVNTEFISRLSSYGFFFPRCMLRKFNPFWAWGETQPSKLKSNANFFRDNLAIGQWRIEKQVFQNRCIDALEGFMIKSHYIDVEVAEPQEHMPLFGVW